MQSELNCFILAGEEGECSVLRVLSAPANNHRSIHPPFPSDSSAAQQQSSSSLDKREKSNAAHQRIESNIHM